MAYQNNTQQACYIAVHPDRVHPNTPNPFKPQTTRGLAPKKSNADISGLVAEGIMVVLESLGKGGASVETLTRHPALRNSDLDWLQEFAYIYKTGWLDTENSEVSATEVRVSPRKEPRVEEKLLETKPTMLFPDTPDDDSDSASIQLERTPLRLGSRRDKKLSAWKSRHLESACHHCRAQHSMCDGAQPSCVTCRDMDRHCFYDNASAPGWRSWSRPINGSTKFDLDTTVSKLKSWLLSRPHHNSPQLGAKEELDRRPSLSSHLGGWISNAKKRCSPTSLTSVVGRSRGGSNASRRDRGRGVLGLSKGGGDVAMVASGVGKVDRLSVKSQAATVLAGSDSQSQPTPPALAQSRSSSDRRSSLTRSGSFQEKVTVALQKAADDAKQAPPDCPPRPFQCTFCLQQCMTKSVWQYHEESHQHNPQSQQQSHHNRHRKPSDADAEPGGHWNWNCGFCHKTLTTWGERVYHIGNHYDDRMTMASWDPLTSPHPFDKTSLTYVGESPRWSTVKLLVAQKPELFNHITRTGETEKLFRCRFCDTRYRTWEEFECHHELWHRRHFTWSCPTLDELKGRLLNQEQKPQPTPTDANSNSPPSPTICPCCSTPTPAPYLLTHLATVHHLDSCTRHGVRFATERHFRMHLANRHGFHEGSTCGEGFVEGCKKVEAPLEVERREVVGRR